MSTAQTLLDGETERWATVTRRVAFGRVVGFEERFRDALVRVSDTRAHPGVRGRRV